MSVYDGEGFYWARLIINGSGQLGRVQVIEVMNCEGVLLTGYKEVLSLSQVEIVEKVRACTTHLLDEG